MPRPRDTRRPVRRLPRAGLLVPHPQSGRITPDVTALDGFERTVDGFLGMLRGENTGKMLIRTGARASETPPPHLPGTQPPFE